MIFNLGVSSGGGSSEDVYKCNGVDDNVQLSAIAREWLEGGNDYLVKTIKVQGNIGITGPIIGTGASSDKYKFFNLGLDVKANRKIIFDFAECSVIAPVINSGFYYVLFGGKQIYVKNVHVIMENESAHSMAFDHSAVYVWCEKSRFIITGNNLSCIARTGEFIDCVAKCTSPDDRGMCFYMSGDSVLKINGGEYYSYVKTNTSSTTVNESSVLYCANAGVGVGIMNNVSCPTLFNAGYKQTYFLNHGSGGYVSCVGTISRLQYKVNSASGFVINTMNTDKPNILF